jgi:hypothetical protein
MGLGGFNCGDAMAAKKGAEVLSMVVFVSKEFFFRLHKFPVENCILSFQPLNKRPNFTLNTDE